MKKINLVLNSTFQLQTKKFLENQKIAKKITAAGVVKASPNSGFAVLAVFEILLLKVEIFPLQCCHIQRLKMIFSMIMLILLLKPDVVALISYFISQHF